MHHYKDLSGQSKNSQLAKFSLMFTDVFLSTVSIVLVSLLIFISVLLRIK